MVIDADRQICTQASLRFAGSLECSETETMAWRKMLFHLLAEIPVALRRQIGSIAINGTSSTVLVCDEQGTLLHPPLLYNDARGISVLSQVKAVAPAQHTVVSATSSLTKLLWLAEQPFAQRSSTRLYFLHQADWLSFWLHGKLGISDYHNALKLGYDVGDLCYPDWLLSLHQTQNIPFQLPQVLPPGTPIAPLLPHIAQKFDLPIACLVCTGTTDSIAAFLASGATAPGEAVTSLGSTLVLKLLSQTRIDRAEQGIYSHRLGDLWLVGGASNTGGAVLQQFFTSEELAELSQQIDPDRPSPYDYYPLLQPGERFPINDPHLLPRLEPRPENPVEFLQGLLESIAHIEATGYELLQTWGASPLTQVYTAGGGAKNQEWRKIRSRLLNVPVLPSHQTEAAYGTALLARSGLHEAGSGGVIFRGE